MKLNADTAGLFVLVVRNGSDQASLERWMSKVAGQYDEKRVAAARSLGLSPDATWLEVMTKRRQLKALETAGHGGAPPRQARPSEMDRGARLDESTATLTHV